MRRAKASVKPIVSSATASVAAEGVHDDDAASPCRPQIDAFDPGSFLGDRPEPRRAGDVVGRHVGCPAHNPSPFIREFVNIARQVTTGSSHTEVGGDPGGNVD